MAKPKKVLKIIGGVIIFFTLPTLLFFAFMYFKYNEDLPTGELGPAADQLATKMLIELNHDAYKATDYIEFTFKKRHHFKWNKAENTCQVYWKNNRVDLDLANHNNSKVFVSEESYIGDDISEYIQKAVDLFNNDSFWLVAPYKVFDEGVERRLVKTENNKDALLVSYTYGGSTPGDSYLWHFDDNGKPTSYQMWTDILPIDGLEASWSDWTTTETGVQLPSFHNLFFIGLEIDDVKTIMKSNVITCIETRTPNPKNDGSTDEILDDIYIKTCKFKNYKSIAISDPDYQGRILWNYGLHKNDLLVKNSELFSINSKVLEQLLDDKFRKAHDKDIDLEECYRPVIYRKYSLDEFDIEFNEDQSVNFIKHYSDNPGCFNTKIAIETFKMEDVSKYISIE